MDYTYKPKGVCPRQIHFSVEDGKIKNVRFDGGCNGNGQGVSALLEGMEVHDAIARMKGIQCGMKGTSCPDQLAAALAEAVE